MSRLTVENVLESLESELVNDFLPRQVRDASRPDFGDVIEPSLGIADALGSMRKFVGVAGLAVIAAAKRPGAITLPDDLIPRTIDAMNGLLRLQRPSGCVDFHGRDYDTSASVAFAVQFLCPVIELGRDVLSGDAGWQKLLGLIETFVRRAVPGMIARGFHTPNHRWVVSSALAQAGALFPDLDVRPTIAAYLAEGIDINEEGAYTERSAGIYDAISNWSLLLLAPHAPDAEEAVRKNLEQNLALLYPDGSADTGLSHRQDAGARVVSFDQGAMYWWHHQLHPTPDFAAAASLIWQASRSRAVFWWAYVALRFWKGQAVPDRPVLPDLNRPYPKTGFWTVRRGPLQAIVFKDSTRILGLRFGQAELSALRVFNAYMGTGRFAGDTMDVTGNVATLTCDGRSTQFGLPGAWKPLGCRLDVDNAQFWSPDTLKQRELVPMERWNGTLTVKAVGDGFDLHFIGRSPYDRIIGQITFDFPAGGIWETDDTASDTHAGQILFLKRGYGTMRYGNDVIRIGPGNNAHRTWRMRDSELAPKLTRVIVPFLFPMEHRFTIRGSRGW